MFFQVIINSFSGFGPFCILFTDNEPCTVFDLKRKLAKTITVGVEEQKIRSLGGKLLTDSVDLFQSYGVQRGGPPIILNLTVRLVGGRLHPQCQQLPSELQEEESSLRFGKKLNHCDLTENDPCHDDQTAVKKIKLDSPDIRPTLQQHSLNTTATTFTTATMAKAKGKERLSRKRKAILD
ncbi:hypothetical protein BDF20DRAFT_835867 [Mycotypha africana]|uniref:uncharacterized protein n=1 Tax=Mycotypha africana TaxID=64632 RepID=UPI0022FFD30F|nr:uncharacterized protein BDF20DRAFT_835867 [Mycotypha africana]KAI8977032.1 hypothetical protein BDF20DRAFT_835867 [Mycotypha africana]